MLVVLTRQWSFETIVAKDDKISSLRNWFSRGLTRLVARGDVEAMSNRLIHISHATS